MHEKLEGMKSQERAKPADLRRAWHENYLFLNPVQEGAEPPPDGLHLLRRLRQCEGKVPG